MNQEVENPTVSNDGASITDRLERYLAAEDAPETPVEPSKATQAAEATDSPVDGDQEPDHQTLSTADLAEVLGIDEASLDVGDDGKVIIKSKIDGSESKATLKDLLKTYQLQGHAENKVREAAEKSKAADARMQEVERAAQARLQQVEGLANVAAHELMREFQSINWQALEQADAGQAALLRQKFAERNAQLQGVFQNINGERQKAAQTFQQQKAQFLQQEAQRLAEVIPEWKDSEVANREKQEIVSWMQKQGATSEQMQRLNESTAFDIAMVRRAMLFDKLQSAKPAIENKVRTAPKLVKPGQAVQNSQAEKLKNLKQQVIRSGGKRGIADYLMASGKV